MKKSEAILLLKDHKENFNNSLKCRLINPDESESGKLSKVIIVTKLILIWEKFWTQINWETLKK